MWPILPSCKLVADDTCVSDDFAQPELQVNLPLKNTGKHASWMADIIISIAIIIYSLSLIPY